MIPAKKVNCSNNLLAFFESQFWRDDSPYTVRVHTIIMTMAMIVAPIGSICFRKTCQSSQIYFSFRSQLTHHRSLAPPAAVKILNPFLLTSALAAAAQNRESHACLRQEIIPVVFPQNLDLRRRFSDGQAIKKEAKFNTYRDIRYFRLPIGLRYVPKATATDTIDAK